MTRQLPASFTYQDCLRAVGAWLDVRGYREIRIVEDRGTLVVEAAPDAANQAAVEVLRFDADHMARLRKAALNDRGAPRAYPSFDPTVAQLLTASPAEGESVPGQR
jgi:hypothetical protein